MHGEWEGFAVDFFDFPESTKSKIAASLRQEGDSVTGVLFVEGQDAEGWIGSLDCKSREIVVTQELPELDRVWRGVLRPDGDRIEGTYGPNASEWQLRRID